MHNIEIIRLPLEIIRLNNRRENKFVYQINFLNFNTKYVIPFWKEALYSVCQYNSIVVLHSSVWGVVGWGALRKKDKGDS